ncbi:YeiH family protein [Noviherbaspirillum massiliense]|uniref:YeiH family protein n=1 Tax=Noviherbaspirillum massiliense TaxID=1465823 RepID=UPI00031C56E4|nr:YeiH family protein [Noviherbaspirillum massiliense]
MNQFPAPLQAATDPLTPESRLRRALPLLPGVVLSALIALASMWLGEAPWLKQHGLSALVIAMSIGMIAGNTLYARLAPACAPGVAFSKQRLLRLGIIFFGIHLTLHDIGRLGLPVILTDALILTSTFALALLIGKTVLKMDTNTVCLIGAGSSICGAAAVIATDPVLGSRSEQVTVAVSTVVVFGTIATFLYPLLYQLNLDWQVLPSSHTAFGMYAGSTIHEVAQVVATARSFGPEAANTAVVAKMLRVMMLPLFLLALSFYIVRRRQTSAAGTKARVTIPWFAFGFVGVVILNSLLPVPQILAQNIARIDALVLTMAMAALGLTTHASAFRLAGKKPILLAAILFAWLIAGGAWINSCFTLAS